MQARNAIFTPILATHVTFIQLQASETALTLTGMLASKAAFAPAGQSGRIHLDAGSMGCLYPNAGQSSSIHPDADSIGCIYPDADPPGCTHQVPGTLSHMNTYMNACLQGRINPNIVALGYIHLVAGTLGRIDTYRSADLQSRLCPNANSLG